MAYGSISLEKRLKDNIKDYSLSSLLDTVRMGDQLELLHKLSGVEILVTDRHGEKMISYGNFVGFKPDVVNDPVSYPDTALLENGSSYNYLPGDVTRYVESLFMKVRNG